MESWDSVDYIKKMERVVNILRNVTKDGDAEVENVVSENTVMDEEVDVEQLKFAPGEPVSEVDVVILVEFWCTWSFDHENVVSHFN